MERIFGMQAFAAALVSGVATVLVVTISVTALAETYLDVSLVVGVPIGLFAGILVAVGVSWIADPDRPERTARLTAAVIGFALTYLLVYFIGAPLANLDPLETIVASAGAGVLVVLLFAIR